MLPLPHRTGPTVTDQQPAESTTMRVPRDVLRMIDILASFDGMSVAEFNDRVTRAWVANLYRERIAAEGRGPVAVPANDLGGES